MQNCRQLLRRELFSGLAFAAAWPTYASAQKIPVVGFLNPLWSDAYPSYVINAFHLGLQEFGYTEGRNVKIEFAWAGGDYRRLPDLAMELMIRNVDVIAATGGDAAAFAARNATTTIPIVFNITSDPVGRGLIDKLNRPGGNITEYID